MRYLAVIQKTGAGYCAGAPDVPGCVAAGSAYEETKALFREALEFHLEDLRETGEPVPEPSARASTALGYAVVVEKSDDGYSAWPPDLPDLAASAGTPDRAEALLIKAVAAHISRLRLSGEQPAEPAATIVSVDVSVPELAPRLTPPRPSPRPPQSPTSAI